MGSHAPRLTGFAGRCLSSGRWAEGDPKDMLGAERLGGTAGCFYVKPRAFIRKHWTRQEREQANNIPLDNIATSIVFRDADYRIRALTSWEAQSAPHRATDP